MSLTGVGASISEKNQMIKSNQSSELLSYLSNLADRADCLANRVADRLNPVMTPEFPETVGPQGPRDSYVPLLKSYQDQADAISRALRHIESCIDRLEI